MTIKKIEKSDLWNYDFLSDDVNKNKNHPNYLKKSPFETLMLIYEFFANVYEPDLVVDSLSNYEQTLRKVFYNLNTFKIRVQKYFENIKDNKKTKPVVVQYFDKLKFEFNHNKNDEHNLSNFLNKSTNKEKALELIFTSFFNSKNNKNDYLWELLKKEWNNYKNEYKVKEGFFDFDEFFNYLKQIKRTVFMDSYAKRDIHEKSLADFPTTIKLENINNKVLDNIFLKISVIFLWNAQATSNYIELYKNNFNEKLTQIKGIKPFDQSLLVQQENSFRYNYDLSWLVNFKLQFAQKVFDFLESKNYKFINDDLKNLLANANEYYKTGKIEKTFHEFSRLFYLFDQKGTYNLPSPAEDTFLLDFNNFNYDSDEFIGIFAYQSFIINEIISKDLDDSFTLIIGDEEFDDYELDGNILGSNENIVTNKNNLGK